MKIGILGTGSAGQALAKGLLRASHEIRFGSRDPSKAKVPAGTTADKIDAVSRWAEVIFLAVPYRFAKDSIRAAAPGLMQGKILVDVTNPIAASYDLLVGHTTSGAEEITQIAAGARVVKAFNTVFARYIPTGKSGSETLTVFVAADDARAKETVMRLARDIGFDVVDAGPLRSARFLEPMAMQLITLGRQTKLGWEIAYRLVHEKAK